VREIIYATLCFLRRISDANIDFPQITGWPDGLEIGLTKGAGTHFFAEETFLRVLSTFCRNRECRVVIDLTHSTCLGSPVIYVVLDNAKRIDPKVLDVEITTYTSCVDERLRRCV
jgi:hypothetical protein